MTNGAVDTPSGEQENSSSADRFHTKTTSGVAIPAVALKPFSMHSHGNVSYLTPWRTTTAPAAPNSTSITSPYPIHTSPVH